MIHVLLTAIGVGGATVFGAAVGFLFSGKAEKYGNIILSFAAGVMLFSSFSGLILPALELGGRFAALKTIVGIFVGGFCILLPERFLPEPDAQDKRRKRALMTVLAIALHNLPEGIAAGVGFGTDDVRTALFIAVGIALQNIPEGCVVTASLVSSGFSSAKAFLLSALTGVVEVCGTLLGYLTVSLSSALLPYALSFAAGAMLYVVVCEMMCEMCEEKRRELVLTAFLIGVGVMVWAV